MESKLDDAIGTIILMSVAWVVTLLTVFIVGLVQLVRRRPSRWWGGAAMALGVGNAVLTSGLMWRGGAVIAITDIAVCASLVWAGVANIRGARRSA